MSLPFSTIRYFLIGGTIIAVPLLAGTVHIPVIAAVGLVVMLTAGSRYLVPRSERAGLDLLAGALFALCLFTVFQALPLPPGLLRLISPASWETQSAALRPLGVGQRSDWMSISLDQPATWLEAAKLAIALLAYQNARDLVAARSRQRVLKIVAAAGVCVALVGLFHLAAGASDTLYGLFSTHGATQVAGPFINGNHQAGFLALTGAAAVGLTLESRDARMRALWAAATVLILTAGLLARSRAGTVAVIVAIVLPLAVRMLDKRVAPSVVPFALIGTLLLMGIFWNGFFIDEFADRSTVKVDIWRPAGQFVADFPLVGGGRGAFPFAYTRYQRLAMMRTFTHAENVPLQLVLDYGLIVGGLFVLGWLYGLRALFARRGSAIDWAVASGMLALFLHNLFDFNLEVLGVAIPALALLATRARRDASAGVRMPRALIAVSVAIGVVGFALGVGRQMPSAEAHVRQALGSDDPDRITSTMQQVLRDHPSDYFLPLLAAEREAGLMAGDRPLGRPLPWINRVLTLYPRSFEAHRLTARWFRATGHHQQALVEYRLALDCAPTIAEQPDEIIQEIVRSYPRIDLLSRLTVGTDHPGERLEALVRVLDVMGKRSLADDADRALLEVQPRNERALMRLSQRAQATGNLHDLASVADELGAVNPTEAAFLRGRVALGEQRFKDAVTEIGKATDAKPGELRYWLGLAQAAGGARDRKTTREALERARLVATAEQAAQVQLSAAWIWKGMGETAAALLAFQTASDLDPRWPSPLEALAQYAEEVGRPDLVVRARKQLQSLARKP